MHGGDRGSRPDHEGLLRKFAPFPLQDEYQVIVLSFTFSLGGCGTDTGHLDTVLVSLEKAPSRVTMTQGWVADRVKG